MAKYATHGYDFYFGEFRLPVTPAALTIKTPSKNETVTLINQGEINIVKEQGLREISFSFMLPHQKYSFVKSGQDDENKISSATDLGINAITDYFGSGSLAKVGSNALDSGVSMLGETLLSNNADFSPAYFMPLLEDIKKYKKVFQFKVYRNDVSDILNSSKKVANLGADYGIDLADKHLGKWGASTVLMGKTAANQFMNSDKTKLPNTNIKVVIEDLEFEEDADSHGRDIICNITLKEYKPYSTKLYKINKSEDGTTTVDATTQRDVTKAIPQSVTVKKGDTLWSLCKKHLGDGSKYNEVAKLNKISNPNLIYPGQVIRFK